MQCGDGGVENGGPPVGMLSLNNGDGGMGDGGMGGWKDGGMGDGGMEGWGMESAVSLLLIAATGDSL